MFGGSDFEVLNTCPMDSFQARLAQVNAECCGEGAVCTDGTPSGCSIDCVRVATRFGRVSCHHCVTPSCAQGIVWTDVFADCEDMLAAMVPDMAQYRRLNAQCLAIDATRLETVADSADCQPPCITSCADWKVSTAACKRLFSSGLRFHADGAVLQASGLVRSESYVVHEMAKAGDDTEWSMHMEFNAGGR